MPKLRFASFRLDVEALRSLDAVAKQRGMSRSQLLRQLIADASRGDALEVC